MLDRDCIRYNYDELQSEIKNTKATAAELAKLIDAVGECDWQRFRRHSGSNHYDVKLTLGGGAILAFISFFLCLGPGPIVALLISIGVLAFPFYIWQRWIMLRGELEDAMLLADEDDIAKAISMAKWEYIGFDSAERVKGQGRPELESFAVLRTFQPEDVKRAHRAMKDPVIASKLYEVQASHHRIKFNCAAWGIFAAVLVGVIEYFIVKAYYPNLSREEISHATRKLIALPPLLVGGTVYIVLLNMWDFELERLTGLSKRLMKGIKKQEKRKNKQKNDVAKKDPPEHRSG